jgi:hypothetical protein
MIAPGSGQFTEVLENDSKALARVGKKGVLDHGGEPAGMITEEQRRSGYDQLL